MNKYLGFLLSLFFINNTLTNDTFYLDLAQYRQESRKAVPHSYIHNHRLHKSHQQSIPDLPKYSLAQLKTYFVHHNYNESEILSQQTLYMSDEFVKLAKTYAGYEAAITLLYNKISSMGFSGKLWNWIHDDYCSGLEKQIAYLYMEIQSNKAKEVLHQQVITQQNQTHTPLHCQQQLINALSLHSDTTSIAQSLTQIKDNVFEQADHYHYSIDTSVEDAINKSMDIVRDTSNPHEFIFHTAFVDHVLCDIEDNTPSHKPTLLERSPKLLAQALTTFIKGLNPVKQVKNTCEFIINTAHFVADVTLGKVYLSDQQYNERINNFWSSCEALSPSNLAQLEAEQWIDLIAQCAADAVFFGGVGKVVRYLQEVEAVNRAHQQATRIAQKLKHAIDTSIAEQPLIVTAEGYVLRASNDMKQFGGAAKEIFSDSKALLESACNGLLADLEKEMAHLRQLFDGKVKGFAEFSTKYLKPDYEHIFGLNPIMGRFGISKIGGFHHDFMQNFRNNGVFQFIDKVRTETGFYKSEILCSGRYVDTKTFFPAHWPREKVINKVYEAYNNFVKSGMKPDVTRDGKYIIKGIIEEGIEIEMYITKNGHIRTAYPVLQ